MNKFIVSRCFLISVVVLIAPTAIPGGKTAVAQVVDWTNISNNNSYWQSGSNWSTATVPTSTETARFNADRTYEVWWNGTTGDRDVGFLAVTSGNVTFLNQNTFSHELTINGSGGNGAYSDFSISGATTSLINRGLHLNVLGGGQVTGGATLNLDGSHAAGSSLSVNGVGGFDASGTVNIHSGGVVSSTRGFIGREAGSTGLVTVSGVGSQWNNVSGPLLIGEYSNGTLNIESGGLVSTNFARIGSQTGSGVVNVVGSGSIWEAGSFILVGSDIGNGSMNIESGGRVNCNVGTINGNVSISGTGSFWRSIGSLTVGSYSNGTLDISMGGEAENLWGYVGRSSGSNGTAVVTGANSLWTNHIGLYIGGDDTTEGGIGTLTIDQGARVVSGQEALLWSTGTLNLNGGELQTQSFENTQGGNFNFNGGRLTVDGGSFLPGTPSFSIDSPAADVPTLVIRNGATASLADRMTVGAARKGNLIIDGGGSVSNAISIIGDKATANGVATVSGAGSLWDQTSLTYIGRNGTGTMNISDGGWVKHDTSSAAHIAFGSTSNGTVTVTDPGPGWTNSGELNVGTGGTGTMELRLGGQVSNTTAYVGRNTSASGEVTVRDSGSHWSNSGNLYVGDEGHGKLTIENGGRVSNTLKAYVGHESSSIGEVTVSGFGSQWENSDDLVVGYFGKGILDIAAGGEVTNQKGYLGANISTKASLATVSGEGSIWNNSSLLFVGEDGEGILDITAGGQVLSDYGYLGYQSTGRGEVNVSGEKSQFKVTHDLLIGDAGTGQLTILDRGKVSNRSGYVGSQNGSVGSVTVSGFESIWENTDELYVGGAGTGTLNILDRGQVVNERGFVGSGAAGEVNVAGAGSHWINQVQLSVGESNQGTLNIDSGGLVSSFSGIVGNKVGGNGLANVRGAGSLLQTSDSLVIGGDGQGTLNIESEAIVASAWVTLGSNSGSMGTINVQNRFSRLDAGGIGIGYHGSGFLNVSSGGIVNSGSSAIASAVLSNPAATGDVTVHGDNSAWNNSGNLRIGFGGNGTLNVQSLGLVSVAGTTSIGTFGTLNLEGGRFEFGQTTIPEFNVINAVSGSMAGNLLHSNYTNIGTLAGLRNPAVDISDVSLLNSGIIYGDGFVDSGVNNQSSGQLQLSSGDWMRFGGSGNINDGEINNFGGTILFAQDVANNASGFVTGRGVFGADGGWTNEGVMAFSGTTDVLGDVEVVGNGRIVSSGGTTTTFYDDVVHNGLEIRTAAGSQSVFFGSVSGTSDFTGLGTVFMEGDLRPGNSPGVLGFEGDLVLGSGANTVFELGGIFQGGFDQLRVDHDIALNGDLFVEMYDGFQLSFNDEFLIADVGGLLTGQFNGLSEGGLVGNFGGMDLFITYAAGNGNDVRLFTAVPEPGSFALFAMGSIGMAFFYRRRIRTR